MLLKLRGGRAEAVEGVDISSLVVLEGGGCGWVGSGKQRKEINFHLLRTQRRGMGEVEIDYY